MAGVHAVKSHFPPQVRGLGELQDLCSYLCFVRLEESMNRNQKMQSELKLMKRKYEGLRQRLDEDGNVLVEDEAQSNASYHTSDGKHK